MTLGRSNMNLLDVTGPAHSHSLESLGVCLLCSVSVEVGGEKRCLLVWIQDSRLQETASEREEEIGDCLCNRNRSCGGPGGACPLFLIT